MADTPLTVEALMRALANAVRLVDSREGVQEVVSHPDLLAASEADEAPAS